MNTLEKSWDRKHLLWAMLGPMCVILSLSLLVLKPSSDRIYLPFASAIGLALCYQWKWRGIAIALSLLGAALAYRFFGMPNEDRLWEMGMGLALALGFVITALSVEETQQRIQSSVVDSTTEQSKFSGLEAQLKTLAEVSQAQIQDLKKTAEERHEQVKAYEHMVALAREELISTRKEHEQLHQEVIRRRHSEALAQEKMAECQKEVQLLSAQILEEKSKDRIEISRLKKSLEQLESDAANDKSKDGIEISRLKKSLEQKETEATKLNGQCQKLEKEIEEHYKFAESYEQKINEARKEVESQRKLVEDRDRKLQDIQKYQTEAENSRKLVAEYEQKLMENRISQDHIIAQTNLIQELQQQLEKISDEKGRLAEELAATQLNVEASAAEKALLWQGMRKAEGLHGQLREQFEQKSELLDQARRDLFHTQEQLLKLQLDKTENEIYGFSSEDKALIRHIISTERYYDNTIKALQNEIDSLQSLVDSCWNSPDKL